jgi:hypothetical protein
VTAPSKIPRVLGALAIAASLACATASAPTATASSEGRPCLGLTPPKSVHVVPLETPPTYAAARLSADLPAEVVVDPDGSVRAAAMRTAEFSILAPFAEETLKRGRFSPGAFENNPAAIRLPVRVPIGTPRGNEELHPLPELWVYTAAGQSREARWQLRDSVSSVTIVGRLSKLAAPGGTVVAIAPSGQTKTLLTIPASDAAQQIHQTVSTGKFFAAAGEYRLELRASKMLASARFTVAEDFRGAVINACETVALPRKTGPGN